MLEIRPTCENCNKTLKANSVDAMICTYECTFCTECVEQILYNVCPNCGGGFERRPIRPKERLVKDAPSTQIVHKPVKQWKFTPLLEKLKNIKPDKR